ncbi:hypothetical protein CONLIGDRAFT_198041 [Coniochaeta ligniaria NRRL 30616]|uniref:Uncharacterized protein n=1 Tax=Coniochaeta ligniaria NRRL 30616 TaxID=1408157 RepID=A0A1J7J1E4_9PEZI|nr:hypothetical protein CONLIGDRAFT_198041 [Coniochaeta ligniaria NRRL 30616]
MTVPCPESGPLTHQHSLAFHPGPHPSCSFLLFLVIFTPPTVTPFFFLLSLHSYPPTSNLRSSSFSSLPISCNILSRDQVRYSTLKRLDTGHLRNQLVVTLQLYLGLR